MASDIYDKLLIESSIKLTFPGIDIKEIKLSTPVEVQELTRRRVAIDYTSSDLCTVAKELIDGSFPKLDGEHDFVLIVVKLAKVDSNKGLQPVFVGSSEFKPTDCD